MWLTLHESECPLTRKPEPAKLGFAFGRAARHLDQYAQVLFPR